MNLLNFVMFIPLIGFILMLLVPKEQIQAIRMLALGISLVAFAASLALIGPFWYASPSGYVFVTDIPWIDSPAIRYHVSIDGLSLWLVILTTFLTPLCVLISWRSIDKRPKEFFAFLLLLEFGLIGVFCALDLFLFYVFWEIALVPMYFLVGVWGHDRRIYAAVKFFLYTMTASVLMLGAIIYLYNRAGTFDYTVILASLQSSRLILSYNEQLILFLAFFVAFAVKVPLFPLHTWLPDAHVEAPTAGSVMLASVMLKMGTYGLLRYCLPLFPNAARNCAGWIAVLAIIGIIYGALVAMVQPNMKKLVAYSSVSHLGFVVLGVFSFTQTGLDGAVYQMLNHGISTGALFILVGMLYERRHSLEISAYGGVATPAPWLSTAFMITMLASVGLPMLNNFVGEYLVLQGVALVRFPWAVYAAIGVILAACYMLWLYQRVFFGKASDDVVHHMFDLSAREYLILIPLIVMMVWMGSFTQSFIPPISSTNARTLAPIEAKKEVQVQARPDFVAGLRGRHMPAEFMPPGGDYLRILPEIVMTVAGTLIMILVAIWGEKGKNVYGHLTIAALLASIWAAVIANTVPGSAFSNMLVIDGYATFFRILVLVVGLLTVLSSYQYLRREHAEAGEYHALILFSLVGQSIMVTAGELIMVFIGLEISSIATYVLAGYLRDDERNNEAALKYFLLGSFATAFLLYGIAWIYGATGSTRLDVIRTALSNPASMPSPILTGTAAALMFVGFAFKVSAAPFQIWAPDVYQGAPAPVTAFMSAAPKAAAFAVFVRVYMTAFEPIYTRWEPFVWSSALLTMIIGNFAALMQTNIKRLLAYSSIAHAGYVMVAIAAHNQIGISAVMFYLAAYALMNVGAFAVVAHFSRQGEKFVNVEDLSGLGWKQPVTAALFSIFLLSFIGVPLTAGFFGKFYIFKAALDANLVPLAVVGLLNSAVAAYYYLRILVVMYMHEPAESAESLQPAGAGILTTLWAAAIGTLVLGIFPSLVLDYARNWALK